MVYSQYHLVYAQAIYVAPSLQKSHSISS